MTKVPTKPKKCPKYPQNPKITKIPFKPKKMTEIPPNGGDTMGKSGCSQEHPDLKKKFIYNT